MVGLCKKNPVILIFFIVLLTCCYHIALMFNRTRVVPSRELQDMIWPWVEPEIERIHEKRGLDTRSDFGVTALAFLVFLRHLRKVILQDAAVMLLERAERQDHVYFRSSVFISEEFGRFKQKMEEELAKESDVVRATVEEAMPGVNRAFDEVFKKIDMVERKVDSSAVVALRVLDRMNFFCDFRTWGMGIAQGTARS